MPLALTWSVFKGDSALENPRVAREVFRVALLPADRARIQFMSYNAFMDATRCNAVRVSKIFHRCNL